MNPLNLDNNAFQKEILSSTPLSKDSTRIIIEYSESDTDKLASIMSSRVLRDILIPSKETKKDSIVGQLAERVTERNSFLNELEALLSKAGIEGGKKIISELNQEFKLATKDYWEILKDAENSNKWGPDIEKSMDENRNFISKNMLALSSNYTALVSEKLILHLTTPSVDETVNKATIKKLELLSDLSKSASPRIKVFIDDMLQVLEFKSNINIDREISAASLELVRSLLYKNPAFATILIQLIPKDIFSESIKKLLEADLSRKPEESPSRMDSYRLKTKLLMEALELSPTLRLDLPDSFLDKVDLEGRKNRTGLINDTEDTKDTLGDILFNHDALLCQIIIAVKSDDKGNVMLGFDPLFLKKIGGQDLEAVLYKLIKEMVYLKGRHFEIPKILGYTRMSKNVAEIDRRMQEAEKNLKNEESTKNLDDKKT